MRMCIDDITMFNPATMTMLIKSHDNSQSIKLYQIIS